MKTLNFILILVLVYSCHNVPVNNHYKEHVSYQVNSIISLYELIDSITIIPINNNDSIIFGAQPEFWHQDSSFYFVDNRGTRLIYRFSEDGKYCNKIGNIGRGDKEYNNIQDVFIDDHSDNIYVQSGPNFDLYVFSKNGDFKFKSKKSIHVNRFTIKDDLYWLYLGYNNMENSSRLLHTDHNFNVLDSFLSEKTNIIPMQGDPSFSSYKTNIYFREDFNPIIYQIINDSLKEYIYFDFQEYNVPQSYFTNTDPFKAFEKLINHGFVNIRAYAESEHHCLVTATMQKGTEAKVIYGIKQKNTHKWDWIDCPLTSPSLFGGNIKGFSKNNELICFILGTDVANIENKYINKFKNIETLDNVNVDTDSFILLCKLK